MTTNRIRRRILRAAAGSMGLGALPGLQALRTARAGSAAPGNVLVCVHLRGGNDTLNTVVPHADPAYRAVRGALALPRERLHVLDEHNALHPALSRLKTLWDRRALAIVHGVGYPDFDYSHFQATSIYESGDPRRSARSGWLGRALDVVTAGESADDVLTGWSSSNSPLASLSGQSFAAPQLPSSAERFVLPSWGAQQQALRELLAPGMSGRNLFHDAFARHCESALGALDLVREAGLLATVSQYPDGVFADRLRFAVQLLRRDENVRVIALEQGAYDTHKNQLITHQESLAELDAGIGAFVDDLVANGLQDRVLVLLWSEFARRVAPNASAGTDHGSAQAMLLVGSGVRGGIVGKSPRPAPEFLVDGGNLPMQADFRRLYATLLDGWLGVDSRVVLDGRFAHLGVLA